MKVSLVVVHYHAAELALAAGLSFRRQAAELGVDGEALVVDHGSDAAGARLLAEGFPGRVLADPANPGYAAGVNRGVAAAGGDVVLFGNPDVELFPGALGALLDALRQGAGVAGPRFFWDRERRFLLPPNERRTPGAEMAARLAGRGGGWTRLARRAWRRHARRHWRAGDTLPSYDLSGALLAVDRGAWERVGPFDEGYRLYFEEVDWLLRCRRRGVRAVYQPRAAVLHHYNRSAAGEGRAGAWFAESEARFGRRWHGRALRALLARLTPRQPGVEPPPPLPAPGRPALVPGDFLPAARRSGRRGGGLGELWIEVSSLMRGYPAAAERWTADGAAPEPWRLPAELWRHMAPGTWRLTVADAAGREWAAARFEVPSRDRR